MRTLTQDEMDNVSGGCRRRITISRCQPKPRCTPKPKCVPTPDPAPTPDPIPTPGPMDP